MTQSTPDCAADCAAARRLAVANGEDCWVPLQGGRWREWPKRVAICGHPRESWVTEPFKSVPTVHHDMLLLLPNPQKSKGKGTGQRQVLGPESGWVECTQRSVMSHADFMDVLSMILSKPAAFVKISCWAGWHQTGTMAALLWAILFAAGVDVVVTMETISWDCESDCWLAQEFLWQNKDWNEAHGRILRNHGYGHDQWNTLANRTASVCLELMKDGQWKDTMMRFLSGQRIHLPVSQRHPSPKKASAFPQSTARQAQSLPPDEIREAQSRAEGLQSRDAIMQEIVLDYRIDRRTQLLFFSLSERFGFHGRCRQVRLLSKLLFKNAGDSHSFWLQNSVCGDIRQLMQHPSARAAAAASSSDGRS